jgi:putative transposase
MSALYDSVAADLGPHWIPRCVAQLVYHVTWTTRGKKPVLTGRRVKALREVLSALVNERGVRMEAIGVLPDRVHLLLTLRPTDCAASVVRELRGRSALRLFQELPELRVALGGNLLWNETYGIATVSPGILSKRIARLARIDSSTVGG